ncbi:MAG TPA: glycosyltransferase [Chthoniobacterales bacterium]|jgi:glycosyltransferase involved in cell wall biosynthesis
MRILRCIHSLDPAIGGPLESVRQSSLVLAQRGHEVEVVSLDPPNARGVLEFPGVARGLGGGGSYGYTSRFVSWMKANRARFDVVIVHGIWQYHSLGVWRVLHRTPTPYFVFPHGMLDPWFNRTYPLKHLKKLLYWPWAEYRVLRDAAAVLFTSEEERQLARESFALYRCNEVVVNYGTAQPQIDLTIAREDFLRAFPILRGKQILLFLGRLHEKKGCDLLLEALRAQSKLEQMHLVMAGPTAHEDYLERLKRLAAGMPVTFPGMLRGNLKWGAFAAAEAFILPSHQENFGIAVVEALACGLPVLISDRVNIWREIEANGAGYVESDTFAGTSRLVERWFATPTSERALMRDKAQRCFMERFEIQRATDSLLEALRQPKARRQPVSSDV